jgi:hypothetical protein
VLVEPGISELFFWTRRPPLLSPLNFGKAQQHDLIAADIRAQILGQEDVLIEAGWHWWTGRVMPFSSCSD